MHTLQAGPSLPEPCGQLRCVLCCVCVCAGRQARERARLVSILKKQRQIEDRRSKMGVALTHDEAARRIQAAIRGFLWRRRIKMEGDKELMFIGMKPKVRGPSV